MILDVDQVVRRVLADLEKGAVGPLAPRADTQVVFPPRMESSTARVQAKSANEGGVLEFGRRILSLSEINGRLEGIHTVVVPAKAVITPSVRDELRKREIELRFAELAASENTTIKQKSSVSNSSINLVLHALKLEPTALLEQWKREWGVGIFRTKCIIESLEHLCGNMAEPAASGVVLTRHTAIAVVLANRREQLRAVLGYDPGRVANDADAIGANILIADPEQLGQFKLANTVRIFLQGSPRECPQLLSQIYAGGF